MIGLMSVHPEWPRPSTPPEWAPSLPGLPDPQRVRPVVGVPTSWSGDDLTSRLLQQRIVVVTGALDLERATALVEQLLLLDADGRRPVRLHLSCDDADLDAATLVADTIDVMAAGVHSLASGVVGGAAVGIFAATAEREAHPHATFVLREARAGIAGPGIDASQRAEQHRLRAARLSERIAAAMDRSPAEVAAELARGRVLTATEAHEAGLVTKLLDVSRR
jgi:ATP-dependent Clp protease protease subunit